MAGSRNNQVRNSCKYVLGVVADTHVPDRCQELHPQLLPALKAAGVETIFHAGDISVSRVIVQLESIARVIAVRGNRDVVFRKSLPWTAQVEIAGVNVGLLHGHGSWGRYLWDKFRVFHEGYRLERYLPAIQNAAPGADVVIFGHTHYPENFWQNDCLVFNPGSACSGYRDRMPSFGILRFYDDGKIKGDIQYLQGYRLEKRKWMVQ
jgi:putative phosphoesterase